tara:strand:+ start:560 stop:1177 length:618 start_codon:yes stop_codon:yes gene_type:complete
MLKRRFKMLSSYNPQKVEQAVNIAEHWKRRIVPGLTLVNQTQMGRILSKLQDFSVEQCKAVIDYYSQRTWNVKNRRWTDLYTFFGDVKFPRFLQEMSENHHQIVKNQSVPKAVKPMCKNIADDNDPVQIKLRQEREQISNLSPNELRGVIHMAINEVSELYHPNPKAVAFMRSVLQELPSRVLRDYPQIRKQVLTILNRKESHDG